MKISPKVKGHMGEHYVMARLYEEGFRPARAEEGIEDFDFLVKYPETDNLTQVQVKTTDKKSTKSKTWGGELHSWKLDEKQEERITDNLFYCFVLIQKGEQPRFFTVPNRDVADYLKWENQHYRSKHTSEPFPGRVFRLYVDVYNKQMKCLRAQDYENKWELLKTSH